MASQTYFEIALLALTVACFLPSRQFNFASAQDQKLKLEEVVAKHLESIGTAEARAKASTRVAAGEVKFIARLGGTANVDGQAMMVSSERRLDGRNAFDRLAES
jgi:hypothetical protein